MTGPVLERIGFREREISRRLDEYGPIAHVFSTYEGHAEAGMVRSAGFRLLR